MRADLEHDFADVLRALRAGKVAQRSCWDAEGRFIFLPGLGAPRLDTQTPSQACICLFATPGLHHPGWRNAPEDVLATDWRIMDRPADLPAFAE